MTDYSAGTPGLLMMDDVLRSIAFIPSLSSIEATVVYLGQIITPLRKVREPKWLMALVEIYFENWLSFVRGAVFNLFP